MLKPQFFEVFLFLCQKSVCLILRINFIWVTLLADKTKTNPNYYG